MILIILAAGKGSRYGGAKQWAPVGPKGEPLLAYALNDAYQAGFSRAVLVVPEGSPTLPFESPLPITWVEQKYDDLPGISGTPVRERPWGTAQAVWAARHAVGSSPFAVLNADDYYGPQALQQLAEGLKKGPPNAGILVSYFLKNTLSSCGSVSRALCQVTDGLLTQLEEVTHIQATSQGIQGLSPQHILKILDPLSPVSLNCWGFPPQFWTSLERTLAHFSQKYAHDPKKECFLPDAVQDAIQAQSLQVQVRQSTQVWVGITHRGDLRRVREGLRGALGFDAASWK